MAWSLTTGYKKKLLLVVAAMLILQHGAATESAGAGNSGIAKPGCPDKCGNVSIPYPFGIGQGCFLNEDFNVTCDEGYTDVLEINVLRGEVRILSSFHLAWSCNYANGTKEEQNSVFICENPFKLSSKNKFTAIGCATLAIIVGSTTVANIMDDNNNSRLYSSACASLCDSEDIISKSDKCDGMGCCQISIPANLTTVQFAFANTSNIYSSHDAKNFSLCSYAFLAEEDSFKFNPLYAKSSNFLELYRDDGLPLVFDWVVRSETCVEAQKNQTSYACRGINSVCIDRPNGFGYLCNCSQGYEGNPYLDGGCQQDIDECRYPSLYPCLGECHNNIGSYTCSCKPGTQSDDPKSLPCKTDHGPNNMVESGHGPNNILIGISISFVFIVVFISALLLKCQKRQLAKEKQRFFKQNGGHILYQQILSKQIDTVIIFAVEDLKKATNNFDKSRELGIGGHGTVYKGILGDDKVVAVKRSKIMNVTQTEEFIQEIIILSQINHKNVVRLIGCCLEVEVPILVYEFIPNGTLFQLIHGNHGRPPISLEIRLRIAQESAEALEYLHLSINRPIVHGDVKSLNILLDENFMAKVTDFGASRILPNDAVQLMTMVQGTLGYLDPEYLQERKLTKKSDVYSFGVVLLELITRKTAIYFEGPEEGKNLALSFLQVMKENRVEGLLDTSIIGVGMEELFQEVAQLVSLCLSFKGEERPSMTQVADKLKAIRSTWREILLLKHEETERLAERLGMTSTCALQPSMYWTARMMGMEIRTPLANHADTTNMG